MFLLRFGQHVLCCDDLYGGTNRFFNHCTTRMGIETTFVDGLNIKNWKLNFKMGKTKMLWIETPTDSMMKIIDVVNEMKNSDPGLLVVVDNTFMTSLFKTLGADIVMHSVTKYIIGHSDVIMGALIFNDDSIYKRLKFLQNAPGIIPLSFDCNQVLKSIKTLPVLVSRQPETVQEFAKYLEQSDRVEKVIYPGLKSHPQHSLVKEQYSGFDGYL